jgi:hypothetical protein
LWPHIGFYAIAFSGENFSALDALDINTQNVLQPVIGVPPDELHMHNPLGKRLFYLRAGPSGLSSPAYYTRRISPDADPDAIPLRARCHKLET